MPLPGISFHSLRLALAGAFALSLAGAAIAQQDAGEPVATVNGVAITDVEFEIAAEHLSEALANVPADQRREQVVSYLIDLELLSQAAEEAGIDEEQAFRDQLAYAEKRALMEIYLTRRSEEAVTEEATRELYDQVVASVEPETEVRARHILVESEEEAIEVAAELEGDADFAELAETRSQDPGSAARGGDLGYFTRERMVPEFAEAAFAMEPGEVSEPVQSQFGWHVIKVEDKREQEQASYEDLEAELRSAVSRRAQAEIVTKLRESAEIERAAAPATGDGATPDAAPEAAPAE